MNWALKTLLFILVALSLYILQREEESQPEILVYKNAFDLFVEVRNPYNLQNMAEAQGADDPATALRVWNPPSFFIALASFLALPKSIIQNNWYEISLLAQLLSLALLAYLTPDKKNIFQIAIPILLILSSYPGQIDLNLGQLGSVLSLFAVAGGVFYSRGADRLSGLICSLTLVKPHIFGLYLFVLTILSLRQNRPYFLVFLGLGIIIQVISAEIVYPGIWELWIFREEWPNNFFGGNLGRLLAVSIGSQEPSYIQFLISMIPGVLLSSLATWKLFRIQKYKLDTRNIIGYGMVASAFAAPYGFIFDHTLGIYGLILIMMTDSTPKSLLIIGLSSIITGLSTEMYLANNSDLSDLIYFGIQLIQPLAWAVCALYLTECAKRIGAWGKQPISR